MNFRLQCFARDWDRLGHRNAYGVILTGESGAQPQWDPEAFFASGRADVERFMDALSQIAPDVGRGRALDFGCGVGRITRWLAAHFHFVTGVDVAPSMIARARSLNAQVHNCEFLLNPKPHLRLFETGTFDVVYSRLVLQHVPRTAIRRYISELIRVLSYDGVLMFQLPETIDSPLKRFLGAPVSHGRVKSVLPLVLVRAYRMPKYVYLKAMGGPQIRMSGLPFDEVSVIIRNSGGRLLAWRTDASHGIPSVTGFEYWVGKAR
jgi:SAM-dependent methyltransferase